MKLQTKVPLVFSDELSNQIEKIVISFLGRLDSTFCCRETWHIVSYKEVQKQGTLWRQNLSFYVIGVIKRVIFAIRGGLAILSFVGLL